MGDPKYLPDFDPDDLASHVSRGWYRRYTEPDEVPAPFGRYIQLEDDQEFMGAALLSATTSGNPPTLGGIDVQSNANVVLCRTVRFDPGSTGPHMNADDRLLFTTAGGEVLEVHRHQHPDHFAALSDDTGLNAAVRSGQLPPREEGPLSDFSGTVDFSTGPFSSD